MSEKILHSAIAKWGTVPQMLMAVEECSELQKALLHYMRGRATRAQVAEEIADVQIMVEQMRIVFGAAEVDSFREQKMQRLEERVNV